MDLKGLKSKPACNAMRSISGRNICILGWGIENQALVRFLLKKKIDCQITICDARNKKELEKTTSFVILTSALSRWKNLSNRSEQDSSSTTQNDRNGIIINFNLGKNYNKNLDKYDIIFRSPGYPLFEKNIIKAKQAGVIVSSPMKLFFEICPTKNIIGVTGTKGKGTTASLIYKILKTTGKRVWLGGNIGIAPFGFIDKIKKNDWVVLELSSFQLEDMDVSPKIAVVTNFYKEHLAPADPNNPNYHKSVKAYWDAKANIFKWQKKNDYIVLNSKLKTQNSKVQIKSKKIFFGKSKLFSKLPGGHNQENIAAAAEVAKIVGIKNSAIKKAVANFKGLEHRLELVRELNGIKYYDDSFATTPEATAIALDSFSSPIILFLGGADKGANFSDLAKLAKKKSKFIILLKGQATSKIKKDLIKIGYPKNKMKLANNIKEAIAWATREAATGDIVLLSTACASFGMFKNYKERGDLFKQEIKKLQK